MAMRSQLIPPILNPAGLRMQNYDIDHHAGRACHVLNRCLRRMMVG